MRRQGKKIGCSEVDPASSEFPGFFPGTLLAPELRFFVVGFVVVRGFYQAVSPADLPAVDARDVVPDLPLGGERFRGEDEAVDPEEERPPMRLATTVAARASMVERRMITPARMGVESCHLIR